MPRTQQTFGRQRRIGRAVFGDRRHQCALGRHDDAEHVADHDGADDRADVQVCATTAEHFAETVGGADDQHEQNKAEQGRAFAQGRVAEEGVDEPADEQRAEADGHAFRAAQGAARCQQVQRRVGVEHHAQQRDPRQPSEIGFPLEPVQVVRHGRWSQFVFFQVVDTTAMDRPQIARQPVFRVDPIEVVFQPDEIERRADPGHASDHVNPAHAQVQPFQQMCFHSLYLSPVTLVVE